MKKILLTVFLLCFFTNLNATIKSRTSTCLKTTGKYIYIVFSNRHVQKYGSGILFVCSQGIYDPKYDGFLYDNLYGDKITFGINSNNSHFYKNIGRLSTALCFTLKGLGIGQKHFTLRETFEQTVYEGFIAWTLWHKVYYKTRYNSYWDTSHAQKIIYYPNPLNKLDDAYISMKGNQVYYFDILRLSIGIGGIIKLSF